MADLPDNVFEGSIADLNNIVNSTIATIPLKKGEITKKDLQDALAVYPILSFLYAPNKTTKGDPFQLAISNTENGYDLWICGGLNEETGKYNWYSVAKDVFEGESVDLSDYIKKDAISTSIDENSTDEQITSAKLFYDTVGNIETALDSIISIQENLIGGVAE